MAFPVCKNLHNLRQTPLTRGIFPWSNGALAAFFSHIYFRLFGAQLPKLHPYYCISRHFWYVKIYTTCGRPP